MWSSQFVLGALLICWGSGRRERGGRKERERERERKREIERQRESFLYDFALTFSAFSFALPFSADSLLESLSISPSPSCRSLDHPLSFCRVFPPLDPPFLKFPLPLSLPPIIGDSIDGEGNWERERGRKSEGNLKEDEIV